MNQKKKKKEKTKLDKNNVTLLKEMIIPRLDFDTWAKESWESKYFVCECEREREREIKIWFLIY